MCPWAPPGLCSRPAARAARKGPPFGNGGSVAAHVSSSGTVIPADSIATTGNLGITGAYTQSSAGALEGDIDGANSGQFNVLNVSGTAPEPNSEPQAAQINLCQ